MKVYILGANGFLGKNLLKFYEKKGVAQSAPAFDDKSKEKWLQRIIDDIDTIKPDLVLLPGASQEMGDDFAALNNLIYSNCYIPCRVAEHLLKVVPNSKLVVFGTSWQFADSNIYRPFNLYAASKQAMQDLLSHYALCGLKIMSVIIFDTYGECDNRRKILNILEQASSSGEIISTTPGEQEIDLVHINDICTGVDLGVKELHEWNEKKGILIRGLGSGRPITINELIKRVGRKNERQLNVEVGSRPYRKREIMKVFKKYKRPKGWLIEKKEYQK